MTTNNSFAKEFGLVGQTAQTFNRKVNYALVRLRWINALNLNEVASRDFGRRLSGGHGTSIADRNLLASLATQS